MSGPIIPADQWPEGAVIHTWDSGGIGNWHKPLHGNWHLWESGIPIPDGHDWRVPVMRPAAEDSSTVAPAIDLEQFRCHIERSKRYLAVCTDSSGGSSIARELADADRLLALIDGQSKSGDDTQRLEWLMRNISGAELRRLNVWTDASCDRAAIDKAMQPTKGEGE